MVGRLLGSAVHSFPWLPFMWVFAKKESEAKVEL